MVDMVMTVRGYMALYAVEIHEWIACSVHNPPVDSAAGIEAQKHRDKANYYRAKAIELIGVNTVQPTAQTSFFEAL